MESWQIVKTNEKTKFLKYFKVSDPSDKILTLLSPLAVFFVNIRIDSSGPESATSNRMSKF